MPLNFQGDTTAICSSLPSARYHCGCPALKTIHAEHSEDNVDHPLADVAKTDHLPPQLQSSIPGQDNVKHGTTGCQLSFPDFAGGVYPLSRLYFCEDCHEIRCPQCVQDEIVSYYCPNCLFEVPTASVKGEKNRCARNCFQCPVCHNTLAVNASQESTSSPQVNAGPYFLICSVCRWNSQEINMLFEKPTGLALQLLKSEDNLAATREFNHLKAHFEQHLRVNTSPLPSSFLSLSNSGTFGRTIDNNSLCGSTSRHGSPFYSLQLSTVRQQHQQRGLLDDITTYEPLERAPDTELRTLELLMGLQDIDSVSTLAQRNTQLHEQPYLVSQLHPQRTHLRIKRSKRCRTCRHFLIKPEPKAQTTRFKIKLVARNYLPTITITALDTPSAVSQPQHPCVILGVSTQFALTFTNPLYEELTVSLAIPSTAQHNRRTIDEPASGLPYTMNGSVAIITPHFTISPYNETVEYDDEMFPVDSTQTPPLVGIYNKRNNSTSILVEVIPQALGEFKFPLLVTCKYKPDEVRMDMSLDDIDPEVDMESSMDGSRKANSLINVDDDEKLKCYSFWCLIGLGNVVVPASSSLLQ